MVNKFAIQFFVMKTNTLLFFTVLVSVTLSVSAQVGINTAKPTADLEIVSRTSIGANTYNGIILPKISALPTIGSANFPKAKQAGLMVYLDTNDSNKGVYTFMGSSYERMGEPSTSNDDTSKSNEGKLSIKGGGSNDVKISSNTVGSTDITIAGSGPITVTESGSTITIGMDAASNAITKSLVRGYLSRDWESDENDRYVKIPFNAKSFDVNNNFNTSNNRFTAPRTGYYRVTIQLISSKQDKDEFGLAIFKGNTMVSENRYKGKDDDTYRSISDIVQLNQGEVIEFRFHDDDEDVEFEEDDEKRNFFILEEL